MFPILEWIHILSNFIKIAQGDKKQVILQIKTNNLQVKK